MPPYALTWNDEPFIPTYLWPLALTEATNLSFGTICTSSFHFVSCPYLLCEKGWWAEPEKCKVRGTQLGPDHDQCGTWSLIKGNIFDSYPWNPNMITAFINVPYQVTGVTPPVVSMASYAAQFTFLTFFEEPGVSSSHLCSQYMSYWLGDLLAFQASRFTWRMTLIWWAPLEWTYVGVHGPESLWQCEARNLLTGSVGSLFLTVLFCPVLEA